MKSKLNRNVSLIGIPFDMAASRRGTRLAPEAIRITGLVSKLENLNVNVEDLGNLNVKNGYSHIRATNNLNHLEMVKEASTKLCDAVYNELKKDRLPLILGGDHSSAFGTIKGVLRKFDNPGIIYFDAHADINTEKTSPTGNIHGMPIAALMGLGVDELTVDCCTDKTLKPENIVYVGLRDVDPGEKKLLKKLGIKAFSMQDVDRMGIDKVVEDAIEYISRNTDSVHISFDVDCLDPKVAPGTGVKVLGGLTFREAKIALEKVSTIDKICSVELVEVNPLLDNGNETSKVATALLLALFGESQL